MDLLTQLDNDIDLLLKIMSSSIAYVSRKASHTQLPGSDVPIALLGRTEAVPPPVMSESINELVQDLVQKANEVKQIILHLPDDKSNSDAILEQDLKSLQDQMLEANREYKEAIAEADQLRIQIKDLLRSLCEDQQDAQRSLALGEGISSASR